MSSPSQVAAAKSAANRDERARLMAETMVRHEASDGACTFVHLAAAGFAEAEIEAYRDDARRIIAGLPFSFSCEIPGRREGLALVEEARAIRARRAIGWQPPIVIDRAEALRG